MKQPTASRNKISSLTELQHAFEHLPDPILIVDGVGKVTYTNQHLEEFLGYRSHELPGKHLGVLLPDHFRVEHKRLFKHFMNNPSARIMGMGLEVVILHKKGHTIPVDIALNPIHINEKPHTVAVLRSQTKLQLLEHENLVKTTAIEAMLNGCIVSDAKREGFPIIYANKQFTRITGYSREEVMGLADHFLQGPDTDTEVANQIQKSISLGQRFEGQILCYRKNGSSFWNHLRLLSVKDKWGDITHVVGHLHDCTAEREGLREVQELKETLTQLSRVSTLGELTASITHEINQPLAAISANAGAAQRFMQMTPPNNQEVSTILNDISDDTQRAGNVIKSLHQLLKKSSRQAGALNLIEVINQTLGLIRSKFLIRQIKVKETFSEDLPLVLGDRTQIQQVFLNLLENASDAVKPFERHRRLIEIFVDCEHNQQVHVKIRDLGGGLDENCFDQVFDRFFTTKKEGLGMGLAICRTIVEAHEGRLWGENNTDQGATFHLCLPVYKDLKDMNDQP